MYDIITPEIEIKIDIEIELKIKKELKKFKEFKRKFKFEIKEIKENKEGSLFVDGSKISTNAVWRTRRLGDVFAKLGSGSKKLNDYFTDKKIDTDFRDGIPLLAIQNQVCVVAGLDVSENVKIDGNTDQIVKITFFKK